MLPIRGSTTAYHRREETRQTQEIEWLKFRFSAASTMTIGLRHERMC